MGENTQNEISSNIFNFIYDDLSKVAKMYASYPTEYDKVFPPTKIDSSSSDR